MQTAEPTIRESIMAAYAGLPPGERKLADTVLARLTNLASYSATELAGDAAVSKATAARFFRRIGFDSFAQARQRARTDAQRASPLSGFDGAGPRARGSDALSRHLATDLRNLSDSFQQVDKRMLDASVRLLAKAPRVHVAGLRNGHFIAAHAAYLLAQARESVAAIPHAALTLAENLVSLRRGDVLLVVDFRRRSALLPSIVAAAREAGARLVFLASPTQPPLSRAGDLVVHCLTQGSSIFDSYVAALSTVNYLCAAVARELGTSSRRRLEAIENLHESLDDIRP
ncbi:MAG TPA: MurR/RpiR family transcriptional regulator [Ramlibacter sp.]|nr:MurR/RpiR family transcriptional regulator [Ramlibacter sp.]